jgi:hypothetical protein
LNTGAVLETKPLEASALGVGSQLQSCLCTPCILEGEQVLAFVDSGASVSFVSKALVLRMGWHVSPRDGNVQQCLSGEQVPRVGAVEGLTLENGSRRLKVDLEVAVLSGGEEMIIGIDLLGKRKHQQLLVCL